MAVRTDTPRRISFLGLAVLTAGLLLLSGCSSSPAAVVPEPESLPAETQAVSVYFATGRTLVEEPRVVDAADVYRATLDELLEAAPELNDKIAIVQPQADINSVVVTDGHAVIDFSPAVLDFEADDEEKTLALAAFLVTLGQFPEIEKVSFSVEGKTEGELNGKDVAAFWGKVSLKGQPWDAIRMPGDEEATTETTAVGEPGDGVTTTDTTSGPAGDG